MNFTTLFVFGFISILAFLLETMYHNRRLNASSEIQNIYNKRNNLLLFLALFLASALRSPNTGADTGGYYGLYKVILRGSNGVGYYWNVMVDSIKDGSFSDNLFWNFFNRVLAIIIKNPQLWLAIISGLFLLGSYITIERYSKDAAMSWIYILCVFIYTFILQGLRQSLSMMVILLSLKYVYEKKLSKFLLCIGIAYLFHNSSILFIIVYPLRRMKANKLYFGVIAGAFALFTLFSSLGLSILTSLSENTRFTSYLDRSGIYTISGWFILFVIFSFCFYLKKQAVQDDDKVNLLFTLSMLGLVVQSAAGVVAEMFRLSYYFNMFNMLLVPNCIQSIRNDRIRKQYSIAVMLAFLAYFWYCGAYGYWFFWE